MISILSQGSNNKYQPLTNQEHWKYEKTKDRNVNRWALPFIPEIKSHSKRWPSIRTICSHPKSIWKSFEERKRGKNLTKPKQNRRLLKNLLQGQLSMECILVFRLPTHAEHQKLGLSLSPILTDSGYCAATGAVLNSNTLCLCGVHKHQHKLIKQEGVSFPLGFGFLESHFKTLKSGTIRQVSRPMCSLFFHSFLPPAMLYSFRLNINAKWLDVKRHTF